MFRLFFIDSQAQRITRHIQASEVNRAMDEAFDLHGAQFLTIRKLKEGESHGNDTQASGH